MLYVAHNYFHSFESQEDLLDGESNQGDFLGLIPHTVGDDLADMLSSSEGRAYEATSSSEAWGVHSSHECCQIAGVGCAPSDPLLHPWVFDSVHYRNNNPDLRSLTETQLSEHWKNNGISEGRSASLLFDAMEYSQNYPDLQRAFGQDSASLIRHFVSSGIAEKRVGRAALLPDVFDANAYRQRYSDLREMTKVQLKKHWLKYGQNAGRNAGL